jgi:nicotinamidase-related amidase
MLKIDNMVLVIVDVQGKLATLMYNREGFYQNVLRMIEAARVLAIPIIWNEQIPDKLGPTIPEIKAALPDATPLVKHTFSCCGNEDFNTRLESSGRKQVLLVGMESHVCVYQSTLDLIKAGYEVYAVADAISSRSLENKEIGLGAMKEAGARITSVEMALFEALRVAEGDQFRQIIKIIK